MKDDLDKKQHVFRGDIRCGQQDDQQHDLGEDHLAIRHPRRRQAQQAVTHSWTIQN